MKHKGIYVRLKAIKYFRFFFILYEIYKFIVKNEIMFDYNFYKIEKYI